jgi:integrase
VALGLAGLRRAETFGLDWRHIDLEGGTARIEQAYAEPTKGPAVLKTPKSRSSRRTVPLPPQAIDALRRHRAAELRRSLAKRGSAPEPGRAVFVSERETRRLGSNFTSREFRDVVTDSGLARCTYHALRHSCATLLLGNGVDIKTVQTILGHTRASMTLDRYGHAIPSNMANAGAKLGHALAGSREVIGK